MDAVTSWRSIRRRCAVARSDGVGVLFPGRFEGLSRGGVAFPTTEAREYVLNRRGWGVSSSSMSTSNIRKVTGDNFGFICDETVARSNFFWFPRCDSVLNSKGGRPRKIFGIRWRKRGGSSWTVISCSCLFKAFYRLETLTTGMKTGCGRWKNWKGFQMA